MNKLMKQQTKTTLTIAILTIYLFSMISLASALTISDVSTSPDEIAPGETSSVSVKIENNANHDITKVSVSLELREAVYNSLGQLVSINDFPFAPYGSSSEDSFDEILEDKSKTANFKIIALNDAKSGIYKIPIVISYYDDPADIKPVQTTSLISITINSKPIIDVQQSDNLLIKGQEGKLSIKILNKGTSDIKFLETELGSSTYYSLTSSDKVYIGDLNSNDFDNAEFNTFFKTTSPTSLSVPVTITYKDIFNKEYAENYNIPVKVYSQKDAISLGLIKKSNTMLYAGIAVVVIVVWIIYRRIKKRKKLKINNSS